MKPGTAGLRPDVLKAGAMENHAAHLPVRTDSRWYFTDRLRTRLRVCLLRPHRAASRSRRRLRHRARTWLRLDQRLLGLPREPLRVDSGALGPSASSRRTL